VRTPVGDRYVLETHARARLQCRREPSGHIILSDYTTTGDGFVAALQVLAVVKKQNQPVSKVCHRFDALPQVLKNVRYKSGKPLDNAKVRSAIEHAEARIDGQGRPGRGPSGTEPVIRVMGEGDDKGLIEESSTASSMRSIKPPPEAASAPLQRALNWLPLLIKWA